MEQQEQDAQGPRGPIAKPLGRAIGRYDDDPTSARLAMFVIVVAVITTVVVGGVLMWLVDRREYPDLWVAFWYVLQTVTTVGYGDVVPQSNGGKLIGILIMAFGVSAVSFITAVVTSSFLAWHQARLADERAAEGLTPHEQATHELLQRIDQRLESLERRLST